MISNDEDEQGCRKIVYPRDVIISRDVVFPDDGSFVSELTTSMDPTEVLRTRLSFADIPPDMPPTELSTVALSTETDWN